MDDVALTVNFCETASPTASTDELETLLEDTCLEAGFPHCERIYVGSYFCENYFCKLTDRFHASVYELALRYGLSATLVIPLIGQAFVERAEKRISDALNQFGDAYDEIVVNDVASFLAFASTEKRIGIGRLFSKEMRDARLPNLRDRAARPQLSAEARECIGQNRNGQRPLVELDPVAAVVDVSDVLADAPDAEIALHLPYCFATTGRNCSVASIGRAPNQKFRLGRDCAQQCLQMAQGYLTDENVEFIKHGRTVYYPNPGCAIAGVSSWRIIYSAAHDTMRL